ncbi:glycoside hydrolase family 2 TIM barrel-domain containing protein [Chitinophaga niabensis]|uniref:glycoside hydrolase family 2 TIM barrel-domain containing protein n=1 Tax=Chitinophaga niabensis TaxID=536979 RepID=UPI0031BA4999
MKAPLLFKLASACLLLTVAGLVKAQPVKVEIVEKDNGFVLMRNHKPYFIKGAGGTSYIDRLAKYGGNSIRTWGTNNGDQVLAKAENLGLTVTMGLDVARERHGFNYDDTIAVRKQLEKLRREVIKYRNHPALLMWGIGNELNLSYKNPKVWDAVNDIAKMIHQEDPNHPVTTMLAGVNPAVVKNVIARCPDLDLLAVQVYGGLAKVPEQIVNAGWKKAYIVTEWGPTGHWESIITPWKAAIEETSSEKAEVYRKRYEASIKTDKKCLGSYVFLWGQKQERTPTWYGLFTEAGEESEVIDVMQYLWTGKWPDNRAPHLDSLTLDGKRATSFIYLQPGKTYPVNVYVKGQGLTNRWELLPESTDLKEGGDRESRPQAIPGLITANKTGCTLKTPEKAGAYRLFLYVSNGRNKVATGNIPFFVGTPSQK